MSDQPTLRDPPIICKDAVYRQLRYVVSHNMMGFRVSYVEVPYFLEAMWREAFPPSDEDWGTCYERLIRCHGGITYASDGWPLPDMESIGEGSLIIGFDCAHEGDLIPTFDVLFTLSHLLCEGHYEVDGEVYRNIDYVREQTKKLAEQLHSLSSDAG